MTYISVLVEFCWNKYEMKKSSEFGRSWWTGTKNWCEIIKNALLESRILFQEEGFKGYQLFEHMMHNKILDYKFWKSTIVVLEPWANILLY